MNALTLIFADLSAWQITWIVVAVVVGVLFLLALWLLYLMWPDFRRYQKIRHM